MLQHMLPLFMSAVRISWPHDERQLELVHELANVAERSIEKLWLKVSNKDGFSLIWHRVKQGRTVRLSIESASNGSYGFSLLYSHDAEGEIGELVDWIIANRCQEETRPSLDLAIAD